MSTERKLISRQEALDALSLIRCQKLMQKNSAGASAAAECMEAVIACAIEKNLPTTVETPQKIHIIKRLEPWYKGAETGRDVLLCGHCETRLHDAHDRFCRFCGFGFTGEVRAERYHAEKNSKNG